MSNLVSLDRDLEKTPSYSVRAAEMPASPTFKDPSGDLEGKIMVEVEEDDIFSGEDAAVDPVYHAKARILNAAFQEIGMGKYQVRLLPWSSHRPPQHKRARVCLSRRRAPRFNFAAHLRLVHVVLNVERADAALHSGSCSSLVASAGSRELHPLSLRLRLFRDLIVMVGARLQG